MPLVNYCRKCRTETPLGESCPYCGGRLSKTGEQLSFGIIRNPVTDWFSWNDVLRVMLPAWLVALVAVLAAEASATGAAGVTALLRQGFLWVMLGLLAGMLAALLALMLLRGPERVHFVMDRAGVHARVYVPQGCGALRLYARFTTPEAVERLAAGDDRPPLEGLTLVRRVTLPWESIRRVRVWREGATVLFFHPRYWQVLAMRCPLADLPPAEEYGAQKAQALQAREGPAPAAPKPWEGRAAARRKGGGSACGFAGMSRRISGRSRRCFTIRCTR